MVEGLSDDDLSWMKQTVYSGKFLRYVITIYISSFLFNLARKECFLLCQPVENMPFLILRRPKMLYHFYLQQRWTGFFHIKSTNFTIIAFQAFRLMTYTYLTINTGRHISPSEEVPRNI